MTTTTINNYMTKFIEVLAEKYGYDAEVMQNEWDSLNNQWMSEKKEVADVTKCTVLLKSGPNKGKVCDKKAIGGTETCKTHAPKSDNEPSAKKPAEKKEVPEKCCFILEAGKNKGTRCTKNVVPGSDMCKPHASKSFASNEEKLVTKDVEVAIESENETTHCTITLKSGKNKGKKCSGKPVAGSDTCKKHTSKSTVTSSDEEERSETEEDMEATNEELAKELESETEEDMEFETHCNMDLKSGKNKGKKCPAKPVSGSDMCKKHNK